MNYLNQKLFFVFKLLTLVFIFWILIHITAIFGIFFAVLYPVLWFVLPKRLICIFCSSRNDGQMCPVCHEIIQKSGGLSPKTFTAAFYNGLVLLLFTMISVGIVFFENELLFNFGFPIPEKTVSFQTTTQQEHQLGEIFPMPVKVVGIKQPINTVSFDISYNPVQLKVVDISTKNSFANIFIQKQIDNTAGITRFAGGIPNPGFSGSEGLFATVYLQGLKTGITTVHFLPSSSVLTNNGHGDNILENFGSTSYLILPKNPISSSGQNNTAQLNVLGASTIDKTQMTFYNDKQLPEENSSQIADQSNQTKESAMTIILTVLGNIDTLILSIWAKLF
jgi:Cohesin domain